MSDATWEILLRSGHDIHPVTQNCVACGASKEAILDNVAPPCVRDGLDHEPRPLQFD